LDSKFRKLAFIGAGNMATSIIGGLVAQGACVAEIAVSDPNAASVENLRAQFPVSAAADNRAAIADADVVVLAVKPQVMSLVLSDLAPAVEQSRPLIISIAAGITVDSIQSRLNGGAAVVRCMPNTPALLQMGATALFANSNTSPAQRDQAEAILAAVGMVRWVEEELLLDAVTALSGSGPAYFFLLMEAMTNAGVELGLDPELSNELTLATARGAAVMAGESDVDLSELRRRVTSPGGTTAAALASFETAGFNDLVSNALRAAQQRAKEMASELG
jgi:pyrroline-5-carboxylate reductase